MSFEERISNLRQLKDAAVAAKETEHHRLESLVETLRKGVSIEVGIRVINELWTNPRTIERLKLLLNSAFPKRNGETILYQDLEKATQIQLNASHKEVTQFLADSHEIIMEAVNRHIQLFKEADFSEATLTRYNEFRKEVMRYCELLQWLPSHIQESLEKETINGWEEIDYTPYCLANGDYLTIDDFTETLVQSHASFLTYTQPNEWTNLASREYASHRICLALNIPLMFIEYLVKGLE